MSSSCSAVLVTGSEGLLGQALCCALERAARPVRGIDLRGVGVNQGDILDRDTLHSRAADCSGIIHLAAVSRVVWGEEDPLRCWNTNVQGTRNVLEVARSTPKPRWVLLASSREVYGQAALLPASEETPLCPLNAYGRSKVEAEHLTLQAREQGLLTAIVRLSSVYGSIRDHADRVVPAFARAALSGTPLRLEGADCRFDFTHIDDVTEGLLAVVAALEEHRALEPIHLVSGQGTSLRELAEIAVRAGGRQSPLVEGPRREFDVTKFWGDPRRAQQVLGWKTRTSVEQGVTRLVDEFRSGLPLER